MMNYFMSIWLAVAALVNAHGIRGPTADSTAALDVQRPMVLDKPVQPAATTANQAPAALALPKAAALPAVPAAPAPVVQAAPAAQAPAIQAPRIQVPLAPAVGAQLASSALPVLATSLAPAAQAAAATAVQAAPIAQAAPAAPMQQVAPIPAAPQVAAASPQAAATLPQALAVPQANSPVPAQQVPIMQAPPLGAPDWHTWHTWRMWPELNCLDRLLAGITFATMVKALCMAGNVLVQISPYPQVQRWELRGSTGEADAAPYVSICFGGWQWCYYGIFAFLITKRSGFLVLVHSNVLGAVLGTYYTVAFYRNCKNDLARQSLQKYLTAVSTLILLQVTTIATLPVERALFLTGLISSFCSFVGAISMLASVPTVIRTKDSRSIPGPLVLANMLSAAVWCLCGWILSDPLISAPNIVGCATSGVCLYLKQLYPDGSFKEKDESSDKMSKANFADSEAAFEAMAKLPKKLEEKLEEAEPEKANSLGNGQEDPSCGTGGTF